MAQRVLVGDTEPFAWLDTSLVTDDAQLSMVCLASPALGEVVQYDVARRSVRVTRLADGETETHDGTLFSYLERELAQRALGPAASPVGFALGYVGVLGYELKGDLGYSNPHRSGRADAQLLFCDRGYVFDHRSGEGWLLALHERGDDESAQAWIERASGRLDQAAVRASSEVAVARADGHHPLEASARHDAASYRALIDSCRRAIYEGESYELCLTNRIDVPFEFDALATYRILRRENPAPYSAFLRLPGVSVLSSSPECFLKGDAAGAVESRPIKGTTRRSPEPDEDVALARQLATSEKERAENLMIVDLVRNDLGRVCDVGSVHVPSLFRVETYATVHQLVSTVRGRRSLAASAVACVQACFPGGSMTGAPKRRSLEILDGLEAGARGFYSGALGFFSLDGSFDLSIVIRTLVLRDGVASLGVGGAIVALSDARAEIAEAELKGAALLRVLGLAGSAKSEDSTRENPEAALGTSAVRNPDVDVAQGRVL
jgi:para-aminobenzoate synthetase